MGSIHFPSNANTNNQYILGNQTWIYDGMSWNAQDLGGYDPYWSNVVFLIGNDSAGGGSTTFTDKSISGHSVTIGSGSIAYSTTQAPLGLSSSIKIPATGSPYLTCASSVDFQFGSNPFTIEAYIYNPSNVDFPILTRYTGSGTPGGSGYWDFEPGLTNDDAKLGAAISATGSTNAKFGEGGSPITNNSWSHVAFYRIGITCYVALNGVVSSIFTNAGTLYNGTNPLLIGGFPSSISMQGGYMASMRITQSIARYGLSNFTPPKLPYPTGYV